MKYPNLNLNRRISITKNGHWFHTLLQFITSWDLDFLTFFASFTVTSMSLLFLCLYVFLFLFLFLSLSLSLSLSFFLFLFLYVNDSALPIFSSSVVAVYHVLLWQLDMGWLDTKLVFVTVLYSSFFSFFHSKSLLLLVSLPMIYLRIQVTKPAIR